MRFEGRGLSKTGRGVKFGGGVEDLLAKDLPSFHEGLSYFRPPRKVRRATKNRLPSGKHSYF
jgi:hypothetical protein